MEYYDSVQQIPKYTDSSLKWKQKCKNQAPSYSEEMLDIVQHDILYWIFDSIATYSN